MNINVRRNSNSQSVTLSNVYDGMKDFERLLLISGRTFVTE